MTTGSILVTGASTGIGEACALRFDRAGWDVFAGVRREADADRLRSSASSRLRPLIVDVTEQDTIDQAVKEITAAVGDAGLTAVVNNAGIGVGGPIEYVAPDEWRRQFDVNVVGQIAVTQAVMPLLRRAGNRARIVFMGSIGGRAASPFIGPYSASKHAIEAIGEALRHELLDTGIKVVVVEPGAVKTPIWDKAQTAVDDIESSLPPEGLERYGTAIADMRKALAFQARTGVEPDAVARVVEKAVNSSRPAARYLVGKDAQVMALIARLPDRARDPLARRIVKFATR